jgi:tetratricopeptide (TPR) repeat protein
LNNLAIVHTITKDPAGARPLLERAVRIQENVLGPKHPDLASGLSNLGDVASLMGDDNAAKSYHARAVAILLGRFLARLAQVTLKQGDAAAARALYERSLAPRVKAFGQGHDDVAESLAGLGECAWRQGRTSEAATFFERALAIGRRSDGTYYPLAVETLDRCVAFLRATGQKARAAEMEAQAALLRKAGT